MINAIEAELLKRNKAAVITVADQQGELIALARMDWASVASIVIATNKAWTAAREGKPTYKIGQSARDWKSMSKLILCCFKCEDLNGIYS